MGKQLGMFDDHRPFCCGCGKRWLPAEGVDATHTPCAACTGDLKTCGACRGKGHIAVRPGRGKIRGAPLRLRDCPYHKGVAER
jgi:hypothetical protein